MSGNSSSRRVLERSNSFKDRKRPKPAGKERNRLCERSWAGRRSSGNLLGQAARCRTAACEGSA
eukprot:10060215-Alexandrium_andersonii.AAC.1